MARGNRAPLGLWAGAECTVNRVGDHYFDQTVWTGHQDRISDLDLFAGLGICRLRYPVLWERTAPRGLARADWSWADARLARLRELGVRPVVGLVHHGSGPRHTSLLKPSFAAGVARFARAVAERYPWVDSYTPINEPLTTARFSALYAHWYPHARDERSFVEALLNQCRAVVLAMRAIRFVNPAAQLIQTEDLGKTFSTPLLAYQAEFENQRRWLSFDILCGRLDRRHPFWPRWRRSRRQGDVSEMPAVPIQETLQHLASVLHPMPALDDLHHAWRRLADGTGVLRGPVTTNDLNLWLCMQPGRDRRCGTIGEQGDRAVALQVDDDRAGADAAPEGEIVDADAAWWGRRWHGAAPQQPQQRCRAGGHAQPRAQPSTGQTTERVPDEGEQLADASSTSSVGRSQRS
jgi:hypothetical protein